MNTPTRSHIVRLAVMMIALTGLSGRPSTMRLEFALAQTVVPPPTTAQEKPPALTDTVGALPVSCQGKILREHPAHFDQKMIALTFDDGPDPRCTPYVLDALAKYHAHATFFVVGKEIPGHEALLKRMVAEGHTVGNHTYTHPANPPSARARTELSRTDTLITGATGHAPTCFRPPYGRTDTVLTALAKRHGYGVFLWTIDPGDTRGNGTKSLVRGVLRAPENGDIVILHDGNDHRASVAAVAPILEALSAKGWQFVTLPEMMVAWDTFRKSHPKPAKPHKTPAHGKTRHILKSRSKPKPSLP
ncbi:MAG: oligosaccharide deacetylase [Chthonomonadaceae bacterium]|nr:oligosaccharide deacetylase [Chthonomonadaceae bacterium]